MGDVDWRLTGWIRPDSGLTMAQLVGLTVSGIRNTLVLVVRQCSLHCGWCLNLATTTTNGNMGWFEETNPFRRQLILTVSQIHRLILFLCLSRSRFTPRPNFKVSRFNITSKILILLQNWLGSMLTKVSAKCSLALEVAFTYPNRWCLNLVPIDYHLHFRLVCRNGILIPHTVVTSHVHWITA